MLGSYRQDTVDAAGMDVFIQYGSIIRKHITYMALESLGDFNPPPSHFPSG